MSSLASTSRYYAQVKPIVIADVYDGTGGPAFQTLDPGIAAACPHTPLLYRSSTGLLLPLERLMDLPRGEISCCSPHFLVRYFPTNRAGASNPGDGSISYGKGKPGTARSTAAVRKDSAVKTMSPTVSPRPQHRSPFLAGQRLPAPRLNVWGWCPRKRQWRRH